MIRHSLCCWHWTDLVGVGGPHAFRNLQSVIHDVGDDHLYQILFDQAMVQAKLSSFTTSRPRWPPWPGQWAGWRVQWVRRHRSKPASQGTLQLVWWTACVIANTKVATCTHAPQRQVVPWARPPRGWHYLAACSRSWRHAHSTWRLSPLIWRSKAKYWFHLARLPWTGGVAQNCMPGHRL